MLLEKAVIKGSDIVNGIRQSTIYPASDWRFGDGYWIVSALFQICIRTSS
ncbi:hypothetical protein THIOSC15_320007 [uncultured Thiomicrorhabdus sp.]